MIHAKGTRIVNGSGEPIQLRGVILEGWLMWNGTLWGAGLSSEAKLGERIEGLVGKEAARFRKAVYDTFVTERDIKMIADLGFNVVRVPFNHTMLEREGQIEWTRIQIEFFEDPSHHVNGWIFWPWKRVPEGGWARDRFRHLMEIESTEAWDTVRKHLASVFGLKKIPKKLARQALADFLEASKAENLIADERMIEVLQGWGRIEAPSSP